MRYFFEIRIVNRGVVLDWSAYEWDTCLSQDDAARALWDIGVWATGPDQIRITRVEETADGLYARDCTLELIEKSVEIWDWSETFPHRGEEAHYYPKVFNRHPDFCENEVRAQHESGGRVSITKRDKNCLKC